MKICRGESKYFYINKDLDNRKNKNLINEESILLILVILCTFAVNSKAQKVAVKSNLLYDATTTLNLGLEVGLARKWTLDVPFNYNPWKFKMGPGFGIGEFSRKSVTGFAKASDVHL